MVLLWIIAVLIIVRLMPVEFRGGYVRGYATATALAILALSEIHAHVLPQLRKMRFYVAISVTALLYMGAIVLSSALGMFIMFGFTPDSWRRVIVPFFARPWQVTIGIPFLIALSILFLVEISRRIGPGRLWSLLLGRYRDPREETRLFLLVDLKGSTSLAERLGTVRYSTFLRDFFDDLTEPVLETGGNIVEYVGDEAVITWPFRNGSTAADGLRCFMLFRERIRKRSEEYLKHYGTVPEFKGALHAGPVVVTEVGQVKSQVVFHGDALNTASRVLGECNRLNAELLVTERVAMLLHSIPAAMIEDLGKMSLRGKGEALGLSRLSDPEQDREKALT
jgi:adenylate cyclase